MADCFNVVITGDVDSGKSTLIGRLLFDSGSLPSEVMDTIKNNRRATGKDFEFAFLLDSLEEERENLLTIDSTQAFCKNRKGREFTFIDVPGHRELLNNMLCGSSYADAAVLVIDASKSIEEQTKRHAFILKFIGLKEVIVAINKMDSVIFDADIFRRIKDDCENIFRKIGIYPKYFIPVSAKCGENILKKSKKMPWDAGYPFLDALDLCHKEKVSEDFRFPIQDIYSSGRDKLAVGEIISGNIKRAETVTILPLGKEAKIKQIKSFPKDKSFARTSESIGLALTGQMNLKRGQVICKPSLPEIGLEISAKIFCLSDLNRHDDFVFKCATQEVSARIKQIYGIWDTSNLNYKHLGKNIDKHDIVEVSIEVESQIVTERFEARNNLGRFVLEDNMNEICAIGIIL